MKPIRNVTFRDKSLARELSDELDKLRMDSRERETTLINDLTKSRAKYQSCREELLRVQDRLTAKIAENESVRAENEVYAKEVSGGWVFE